MITYLAYQNDENATMVARNLDQEIKKLGTTISDIPGILTEPSDSMAVAAVNLDPPLPKHQCNFTIATQKRAKKLGSNFPNKNENDLIAVLFNCSAESREEYFPVIYRQGQQSE